MTSHHSDILLPRDAWSGALQRSRLVSFVPIVVALLGVAGILLGGISVGPRTSERAAATAIDPVTTGSIATPEGQRRAIEMLDR